MNTRTRDFIAILAGLGAYYASTSLAFAALGSILRQTRHQSGGGWFGPGVGIGILAIFLMPCLGASVAAFTTARIVEHAHIAWALLAAALCVLPRFLDGGFAFSSQMPLRIAAICLVTSLFGAWVGAWLQKRHSEKSAMVSS
jgi:uncharacterized membrane protein YfcA